MEKNLTVNQRIAQYIDFKRFKKSDFFKKVDMSDSILKSNAVGSDKLARIINAYPDLNVNWVLFGEGKMIKEPENMLREPDIKYGINYADKLIKCQEKIIELQEQLSKINAQITNLRLQQKNIFEPKQELKLKSTKDEPKT